MTLDEAIERGSINTSKQIASKTTIDRNMIDCIREHKQLIDWLKQLKEFREDRKMEIRPSVMKFAADMEQRLRDNDNKIGWGDVRFSWLLNQLQRNVSKLENYISDPKVCINYVGNKARIINTCADIANYSMMISENKEKRG